MTESSTLFSEQSPILDQDRLTELLEEVGDEETLAAIFSLFLAKLAERVSEIKKALTDQNAEALQTTAHTLKGACQNIGATRMAEGCLSLEMAGRNSSIPSHPNLMEQLSNESNVLDSVLEAQIEKLEAVG
ncbi:MAG: Hpt domain-containing protein [Magnetococcales bacterium]|nr:Hpt domain-containing protein [Magnetococcales bacterium]